MNDLTQLLNYINVYTVVFDRYHCSLLSFQLQDMAEYQISLFREIEARLKVKCDKLADAFIMDDIGECLILENFHFYPWQISKGLRSMTEVYAWFLFLTLLKALVDAMVVSYIYIPMIIVFILDVNMLSTAP